VTLVYLPYSVLELYVVVKGTRMGPSPGSARGAARRRDRRRVLQHRQLRTTVYNDIDKVMLSKLSDFASTGIYAAAYRIIDVSMKPGAIPGWRSVPRVFRRGVAGMSATIATRVAHFEGSRFWRDHVRSLCCVRHSAHILGHQYEAGSLRFAGWR